MATAFNQSFLLIGESPNSSCIATMFKEISYKCAVTQDSGKILKPIKTNIKPFITDIVYQTLMALKLRFNPISLLGVIQTIIIAPLYLLSKTKTSIYRGF